ncbi:MAG TPA: 50S ribosomal protein L3 [Candidatus Azoamicus sp.]
MGFKLIAYKCGMTRFFTPEGFSIPVTVIKIYNNYIMNIKKINDKYSSIKISACNIKEKKAKKPIKGIYEKAGINTCKYMKNFSIKNEDIKNYTEGKNIPISILNKDEIIDITAMSKGKGFAGTIKRHNFRSQKASHGNSLSHRAPGSIGQCQTPGKVFKGKKMAGRLGNTNITIKNIKIINIYNELNAILVKGSVPGANGGKVILKKNN